jgi:hypothetical protein
MREGRDGKGRRIGRGKSDREREKGGLKRKQKDRVAPKSVIPSPASATSVVSPAGSFRAVDIQIGVVRVMVHLLEAQELFSFISKINGPLRFGDLGVAKCFYLYVLIKLPNPCKYSRYRVL